MPELTCPPPTPWLAVITRPNLERRATAVLDARGLDAYLPLYHVRRRWSDRVKQLDLPLFPSYTFCRHQPDRHVLPSPGVLGLVSFGNGPALIADAEIAAVRRVVESGLDVLPWPFVKVGQRVTVVRGPLAGIDGIVLELKKQYRLVVSVTMLQRSVAVEIDHDWVTVPAGHAA